MIICVNSCIPLYKKCDIYPLIKTGRESSLGPIDARITPYQDNVFASKYCQCAKRIKREKMRERVRKMRERKKQETVNEKEPECISMIHLRLCGWGIQIACAGYTYLERSLSHSATFGAISR